VASVPPDTPSTASPHESERYRTAKNQGNQESTIFSDHDSAQITAITRIADITRKNDIAIAVTVIRTPLNKARVGGQGDECGRGVKWLWVVLVSHGYDKSPSPEIAKPKIVV
jgi:hypothetical protein